MSTTVFTCITCRVVFHDGDIQRAHYKSDWHRYNLKRKVAELPSVTSEEFQKRVLQQRNVDADQTVLQQCLPCRKTFISQNALENHLNSKRHKEREKSGAGTQKTETLQEMESESDMEEVDSDEWEADTEQKPIDNNDCIFCSHHSRSLLKNVQHMSLVHSFFIPDIEYCADLPGLLRYLAEKVTQGFMCLWCNEKGKTFHSAEAARQHMSDKGHCKMIHEGVALAEYVDFYDYSASYPDADDKETHDIDEEVEVAEELDGNDYQLVLPSGIVVGHRSLMRYYRQSFDPNRVVAVSGNSRKLHKVLAHYKSLGWSGAQQEAASRRARDVHCMKRMQAKLSTRLAVKSNKFQKHFRPQVNF